MDCPAWTVLKAVCYASAGDILGLRQLLLSRPGVLKLEVVLRVLLTYLPVGTEPELYVGFLRELLKTSSIPPDSPASISTDVTEHDLSEDEARTRVRRLRLVPLVDELTQSYADADSFTLFLLRRAYDIDTESGSLTFVAELLEPFVDHSETLRTWMISNLLPLLRLDYEYYPHSGLTHALYEFERLDAESAIHLLLSKSVQRTDPGDTQNIGRDLRGLVGSWIYGEKSRKRRKTQRRRRRSSFIEDTANESQILTGDADKSSEWSHVNEWLVELSLRDFQKSVDAATQWGGPFDTDLGNWSDGSQQLDENEQHIATCRYAQANLACLYATNASSLETIIGSHRTLLQIAKLVGLDEPPDLKRTDVPLVSDISQSYLKGLSPAHLLHNALLSPQNPFTLPRDESIILFNFVLASTYKLLNLGNIRSSRTVAELSLFGSEADQMKEFRRTLHRLKSEKMDTEVWASIRRQILWLRNWEQQPQESDHPRGVFSRIPKISLETELLRAMLDGSCYSLAADTYCRPANAPLPLEIVESSILSATLSAYDAASNGSRTRGGVRKASDIISTFHGFFPESLPFNQTKSLLSATHAMSFYSLTLQHGVPFQPVNIRAHKDPVSLIGKILDQNPESYTHLDDMLEIGQNLVAAGLTQHEHGTLESSATVESLEQESVAAVRRITRMAIEAALEEDDFDTAYSYVVNRLSVGKSYSSNTSAKPGQLLVEQDDISWRAAYQAGRFSVNSPGSRTLRRLEQRMELLSQALLLAPPSALSEVLTTWQKCEEDMLGLIARETAEDEEWDKKGDWKVPGGFTADSSPVAQRFRDPARGALAEEAPMGLFDVARGAAAALSKSTFPLRNSQKNGPESSLQPSRGRPLSTASVGSSDEGSISGPQGTDRVRKRDVVSNMVTGSLASGIGWVIGESPGNRSKDLINKLSRCSTSQTGMKQIVNDG